MLPTARSRWIGRRRALQAVVDAQLADLALLLHQLLKERVMNDLVVPALAAHDHPDTPGLMLGEINRYSTKLRDAAVTTLCSRPEYARELLGAVERGEVSSKMITAFHARQIRSFEQPRLDQMLDQHWGSLRTTSAEKRAYISQLKRELSASGLQGADLGAGRRLFEKSCATCHKLHGQGATTAPDLTGGDRRNLDYLLENIVDPSAVVPTNYRMSIVRTENGRVINGVVADHSESTISIQTPTEKHILERTEIAEMRVTKLSLMPDGILDSLSSDEIRDLVAYISR